MINSSYIKIILTVIAVELLVLVLKPVSSEKIYFSEPAAFTKPMQAQYHIPNALHQTPPETINVRLVDLAVASTKALPVVIYNPAPNGRTTPLKVEVMNEVLVKKAEE